jgi:signal transduction histidine kinase/CheY-like chemotaxis protein
MRNPIRNTLKKIKFEYRIGVTYLLIGFLWIFLSDAFFNSIIPDKQVLTYVQSMKGSFYVIVTSLLLVYLLKRHMEKLRASDFLVKQRSEEIVAQNDEYRKLNEELHQAKEKAEESNRLKSAFLQNMSHEVRTPLNSIVGFSQFMSKPNLKPEKLEKYSRIIQASSEKLIEIVTDVIEISQIQAKLVKLELNNIDIIELIKNIVRKFEIKAKEKKNDLLLKIDIPDDKYFILTDQEKLSSILYHVIDNAVKFTNEGRIEVKLKIVENDIQIHISDTGIGISEEMQEKVFEPFWQVETDICRSFGGNGLGLPIVHAYTELLGASVSLKSELNKGTLVSFLIPKKQVQNQIGTQEIERQSIAVHTILIVEDEFYNYQYLAEVLEECKLKTLYASNGKEAIDICHSNPEIGLILMDIKMPVMDGYTATKHIKEFNPDIIVIAQTAYSLESEIWNFEDVFEEFLTKPIDGDLLKKKLCKYLGIQVYLK